MCHISSTVCKFPKYLLNSLHCSKFFWFMPVICDFLIPSVRSLKWQDIRVGLDSNLSFISFSIVTYNFCMYLPLLWPQFYKLYPLASLLLIIPYDNFIISIFLHLYSHCRFNGITAVTDVIHWCIAQPYIMCSVGVFCKA